MIALHLVLLLTLDFGNPTSFETAVHGEPRSITGSLHPNPSDPFLRVMVSALSVWRHSSATLAFRLWLRDAGKSWAECFGQIGIDTP
jgi:hypothetical protein